MRPTNLVRPILGAAVALAALAPGCNGGRTGEYYGATERVGKELTTFYCNNGAEPEYLDPGMATDTASTVLIYQMFEGLTTYDAKDLHPTQGVATHWDQSDDNRVFRFYLRPDAKWSDGKQVTAYDFEYAWRRQLRPKQASQAAIVLYPLMNAELFHQDKLKVVGSDVTLLSAPRPDAAVTAVKLSKGTPVVVLDRSPMYARVARHLRVPTFTAAAPPGEQEPAAPAPEEIGFVPEDQLVEDEGVLGVRARDDLTLEVELEQSTPYFTDVTSSTNLFPVRKDVIEAWAAKGKEELWWRPENIVTNGPYLLDSWKFRYEIRMKRNPYHYDHDRLKLHHLVFLNVEEYHATMNLYKAGDLDFLGDQASLPAEYLPFLQTKKDFKRFFYGGVYWFELNTKRPPVDDVRVRHALNLALDKALIIEKIARGGQPPATHYVPDFTGLGYADRAKADQAAGVDPFTSPELTFNPARARELLKEAGYEVVKDGDGHRARSFPPLELLYNSGEGNKNLAVAIQDMWKQHLGVSITLRSEEWKVMLKNMRDGNFQIVRASWAADYNHPHTYLSTFLSGSSNNRTGWADKEFDELIRRASATADPEESIRRYRVAEMRAVEGMAKLPIYFYTRSTLVKPWVKGYRGNGRNLTLMKWLSIDPSWRDDPSNEPTFPALELPKPGRITQ